MGISLAGESLTAVSWALVRVPAIIAASTEITITKRKTNLFSIISASKYGYGVRVALGRSGSSPAGVRVSSGLGAGLPDGCGAGAGEVGDGELFGRSGSSPGGVAVVTGEGAAVAVGTAVTAMVLPRPELSAVPAATMLPPVNSVTAVTINAFCLCIRLLTNLGRA